MREYKLLLILLIMSIPLASAGFTFSKQDAEVGSCYKDRTITSVKEWRYSPSGKNIYKIGWEKGCECKLAHGGEADVSFYISPQNYIGTKWERNYNKLKVEAKGWLLETQPYSELDFNVYFVKDEIEPTDYEALKERCPNYDSNRDVRLILDRTLLGRGYAINRLAMCKSKVVCMHELGHAFGLEHDFGSMNYMDYYNHADSYSEEQIAEIVRVFGEGGEK